MRLVDDLKAAHEAATARYAPDEWPRRDAANYLLEELMRLHAAEIIAALEERERLLKVVEAARVAERRASGLTNNPLGDLRHVARTLRAALDALEGKG